MLKILKNDEYEINISCEWKNIGYKHVERNIERKRKRNIKIFVFLSSITFTQRRHNITAKCCKFNMNLSLPMQLFEHLIGGR